MTFRERPKALRFWAFAWLAVAAVSALDGEWSTASITLLLAFREFQLAEAVKRGFVQ